jgi:hypothetical protein
LYCIILLTWSVWTDKMILHAIWKRKESCSRLTEKVVSRIKFEIKQIDRLFELYADLLERVQKDTPDLVDVTAVASVTFILQWVGEYFPIHRQRH